MERYKMLLGEPCRCYHKNENGAYTFQRIAYYVGNGYCIIDGFTDVRDMMLKGIAPILLKYDRYIPTRLWNTDYQYAKERGLVHKFKWNLKEILLPNFSVENFNIENLVDFYQGHLDEFWWWHDIQKELQKIIGK